MRFFLHFHFYRITRKRNNEMEKKPRILSGPPACGKSAIAYNTAFMLEKDAEYYILPVTSPEEIRKYLLPETKQVFVIDDPVGKYTVDDSCIQLWNNEETFIKQIFPDCSNTKLILSCRSYIYKSGFCHKLQVSSICFHCDMLSDNLKLSVEERAKIGNRYNIPEVNDVTITMYDFLPLLCANYSEHDDTALFFVNPIKVLSEEMNNTKEKSDIVFLAIALLVVRNNNVDRQLLSLDNPETKELLNDLFNECGFKYFPSTNLSFIVGSSIIHCLIKYGSSRFLANRLQLASLQEEHAELVIIVKLEQEELYFQRLLSDIKKGYHRHGFTGIQMKYALFRSKLTTFLKHLKAEDLTYDKNNSTPLHVVSAHGFDDLAYALIQLRKDQIIHQDKQKRTPLYMACVGGHVNIAVTLLAIGNSSLDITNSDDLTPFDAASNNGHSTTVTCENNQQNIVDILLKNRANVNQRSKTNISPLYKACQIGNEYIVGRLVDADAKVNLQSDDGSSPLGANINAADKFEFTPLHIACREKHERIVRFLIEYNANVNAVNRQKESPLYIFCMHESLRIVELLLEKNADVNLCEEQRNSPLHAACRKGNKQIVQLLLDKKADKHKRNNAGKTPFDVVQGIECDQIIELLNSDIIGGIF
ncbi:unnamed protein product [Mytilus coruscus]|uniref:Novel STAND NTPase 3 domain-containing protein n=1 Tax=Mytilus coruscus TaxID=42192 RepID=A0A6J8ACT2_MYTCO|nr:unnamed protein product [Mytilus coruscus]